MGRCALERGSERQLETRDRKRGGMRGRDRTRREGEGETGRMREGEAETVSRDRKNVFAYAPLNYRSLLQNIVSFIGLFCKRNL